MAKVISNFSSRLGFWTLFLILALLLVWPLGIIVQAGFIDSKEGLTLGYLRDALADPLWQAGFLNSIHIALWTTAVAFLISLPLSFLAVRCEFAGKRLCTGLVLVPLILPPFVGAIGLRSILGRCGALNALLGDWGVIARGCPGVDFLGGELPGGRLVLIILLQSLHFYPILYLNMTAAMANIDPTLEQAAQNLGAGFWQRFRRVTLPLIWPGIFAGGTLVFIGSLTELGTPLMFDYYTLTSVQIFHGINELQTNPRAYALVFLLLVLSCGLYVMSRRLSGGASQVVSTRASIAAVPVKLGRLGSMAAVGGFGLVIGLAVCPHVGVVLNSFSVDGSWYGSALPAEWTGVHYAQAFSHEVAVTGIGNSLVYAGAATFLCLILGVAVAWMTTRVRPRFAWMLDTLAMLPLAVPGLVLAFGYVAVSLHCPFPQLAAFLAGHGFERLASLCQVTGTMPNPFVFLVSAYVIRRLPFVVRAASAGLEQTPVFLEEAARNLGASTWRTIRCITLPLIAANVIAAAVLVFSFSMLEVSDSLLLAQRQNHFPMTKAIFELFNRLGDGPYIAAAMGVVAMGLLVVTLLTASILLGRRLGTIFRI